MREIYNLIELSDREKLLVFLMSVPCLKEQLTKEIPTLMDDARVIFNILGQERLDVICDELNETIFDPINIYEFKEVEIPDSTLTI